MSGEPWSEPREDDTPSLRDENAKLREQIDRLTEESSYAYAAMGNFLHEGFGWEKKQEGAYRYAFSVRKFIEVCNDKLTELRTALEIALPEMVHTFSGHVYEDGKLVEFVDGCGKCRALKALSNPMNRKNEQPIHPHPDPRCSCGPESRCSYCW